MYTVRADAARRISEMAEADLRNIDQVKRELENSLRLITE
jgi:hypothetical protein